MLLCVRDMGANWGERTLRETLRVRETLREFRKNFDRFLDHFLFEGDYIFNVFLGET